MNPVVRQFTVNKNELAKDHCLEHISEIKEMLEDERVLRVTTEESKSIVSKIEGAWDELRQLRMVIRNNINMNTLNLVGCGGVGLKIARELSFSPPVQFETVRLWDSDTVEDRNLERQLFTPGQVGMSKSEATSDLFFNGTAESQGDLNAFSLAHTGYISDSDEKWNDIFIMATDNNESRLLMLSVLDDFGSKDALVFSAANATADDGLGIGSTAWVYSNRWKKTKKILV